MSDDEWGRMTTTNTFGKLWKRSFENSGRVWTNSRNIWIFHWAQGPAETLWEYEIRQKHMKTPLGPRPGGNSWESMTSSRNIWKYNWSRVERLFSCRLPSLDSLKFFKRFRKFIREIAEMCGPRGGGDYNSSTQKPHPHSTLWALPWAQGPVADSDIGI